MSNSTGALFPNGPNFDANGNLNVNIQVGGGGGGGGTQYTGSPVVGAGAIVSTAAAGYDGANVRPLLISATGQLHTIIDSATLGTVTVTGTVAVTQSTSPWVVSLASTTITGTVAVTQSTSPWVVSGTVTANAGTGNFTVVQGTAASLNATIVFASPQHVIVDSGSITANAGSGNFNVVPVPTTSGGLPLPFSSQVTAKAQVKATAGNVYGWSIMNTTAAIAYVQVFNLASASVTLGTTTPDYVIPVPANGTTGAGNNIASDLGVSHSTGITVAATTTRTGSTTAACDVLFFFN